MGLWLLFVFMPLHLGLSALVSKVAQVLTDSGDVDGILLRKIEANVKLRGLHGVEIHRHHTSPCSNIVFWDLLWFEPLKCLSTMFCLEIWNALPLHDCAFGNNSKWKILLLLPFFFYTFCPFASMRTTKCTVQALHSISIVIIILSNKEFAFAFLTGRVWQAGDTYWWGLVNMRQTWSHDFPNFRGMGEYTLRHFKPILSLYLTYWHLLFTFILGTASTIKFSMVQSQILWGFPGAGIPQWQVRSWAAAASNASVQPRRPVTSQSSGGWARG